MAVQKSSGSKGKSVFLLWNLCWGLLWWAVVLTALL